MSPEPELRNSYSSNVAAQMDIRYWWMWVRNDLQGICPHCLLELSAQDPEFDLYPHFTGRCIGEGQ